MSKKEKIVIRLKRGEPDRVLPKDFYITLIQRCLPILSLTYISTIIGIAAQRKNILHFLFEDKTAYEMALFVVLWVSGPALMWMFIKGSISYRHVADTWYLILASIMTVTLLFSYILFPEASIYGLRIYFAASAPVFLIMYFFLVKNELPAIAAYPLNAMGFTMLLYGALINILHHV